MKPKIVFVAAMVGCFAGLASADVKSANAVYIMPMSSGLDQYLALRFTTSGVMQVVTDPLKADVILTDRVGAGLDDRWKELYPPVAEQKDDKEKAKDEVFTVQRGASQPLSRSRGAMFLIDRSTRNIIWSTYARPKSTGPDDLNHVADQIARELAKARKAK